MAIFTNNQRIVDGARRAERAGGLLTTWQQDAATGKIVVGRFQDVEPILKRNREIAAEGDGFTPSRSMRYLAEIPNVVAEIWMQEGINIYRPREHAAAIRKKLNDPEWRHLRTSPGRV